MKKLISLFRENLLPARQTNSRGVRGFNFRITAFGCALLTLVLFGGIGTAQAQQPDPLTITKDGKVGVGTPIPANKLSVAGDADVSGKLSVAGNADFSGAIGIGTNNPGTSRFRIANSSGDFAHFRFDAAGGGGELEFVGWANGWNINSKTAGRNLYLNRDANSNSDVLIGHFGSEVIVKGDTGNLGIGTTSPARALDIRSNESSAGMLRLSNTTTGGGEASIGFFTIADQTTSKSWVAGVGGWGNTGNFVIGSNSSDTGGVKLLIDQTGNVGIGTSSPGKGKLEINGSASGNKPGFANLRWFSPNDIHNGGSPNEPLSIYASSSIGAANVFVFSDERIKKIHGRSEGAKDLQTLLGIEITDYDYGDVIQKGGTSHKKVIGQQVEKVFPEAVIRSTDVVPDIYQKATIKDGWVMLATTLQKGDRVRLIGKNQEGIHEVLEVANGKFRTGFAPDGDQVFVYGREVKDFRSVDYDAISMLNVSATQQIKKEKDAEVKALQEENAALRNQLAEQEKRLTAIEALLLSAANAGARTASLKKAN